MAKYVATEYATRALLDAAIIALDTTSTFEVYPYVDTDGATKWMMVTPHPKIGS
jgi:hypothetical protein